MNKLTLFFSTILILALSSSCTRCTKGVMPEEKDHTKISYTGECEWNEAVEINLERDQKYVVEELKFLENCECPTSGLLKYVQDGKTSILIKYVSVDKDSKDKENSSDSDCNEWAVKVNCVDGDCEHPSASWCKFKMNCTSQED